MADMYFGNYAIDMTDPTPDVLMAALNSSINVSLIAGNTSQITVPLFNGTQIILNGNFNFSNINASSISGISINSVGNVPVFSLTGLPPIPFSQILSMSTSAAGISQLAASIPVTIHGGTFNDILVGGSTSETLLGNDGSDDLRGKAGNDLMNGGAGNDTMTGGVGNDTYVIDTMDDVLVELPGQGSDMVVSPFEYYVLPDNFENLGLDQVVIHGVGNAGNNMIVGNFMNNVIDGGAGNDMLMGMSGDDIYFVDSSGDVVFENGDVSDGDDTVYSTAANFTIGANVETLVLLEGAIGGTGNAQNNDLIGNSANNVLSGGAGNDELRGGQGYDLMTGGAGNDTYYVNRGDGAGVAKLAPFEDQVVEALNGGIDTVHSRMYTYTLDANVENLVLEGIGRKGFGNALNNVMTGSARNNTLDGGAGNDTLNGSTGVDRLTGGAGNDSFAFDNLDDVDRVLDFNAADDTILLSLAVFEGIGTAGAAMTSGAFAFGSTAGEADDRILYDTATGALYYDHDGNGGDAAVQFALLSGAPALTAADIAVIA